jgi:hypothetical protein
MAKRADGFEGIPPHVWRLWQQVARGPSRPLRDPGPEWLSTQQLARIWGVTHGYACHRVKMLLAQQRIERSTREIFTSRNSIRECPVYRLKESSA